MTNVSFQSDLVALARMINLPFQPDSVKWQTASLVTNKSQSFGPEDWGIVVLMKISDKDFKSFMEGAQDTKSASLPAAFALPWLSSMITSEFRLDTSGSYYEFTRSAVSAEAFYRSPLLNGAIFPVSSTELLLYLHTQ